MPQVPFAPFSTRVPLQAGARLEGIAPADTSRARVASISATRQRPSPEPVVRDRFRSMFNRRNRSRKNCVANRVGTLLPYARENEAGKIFR